jgi:hypothetical protein
MTLPVSGNPLSLSQIQGEFGGSNPAQINEYYAGGSYVPTGTVGYPGGVSTPIPASGTLSIANFYGSTVGNIYLNATHQLRADMGGIGGAVAANITLFANGVAQGRCTKSLAGSGSLRIDGVWSNGSTGFTRAFLTSTDPVIYPTNEWVSSGTVVGSYFSARATWTPALGSATPSGTLGSWVTLNTQQSWVLSEGGTSDSSGSLLLEIAKTADTSSVIASSTINLIAISAP